MSPSTLFAVWPDRNKPWETLLVSAAPGEAGADAIRAAFPGFMIAVNGRELMVTIQRFRLAKRFYHWSAMQRHGTQYMFVVAENDKPAGLINVRAKKVADALKVASKHYPNAKFQPLGDMAQYVEMAARIANVMEGRGRVDWDLQEDKSLLVDKFRSGVVLRSSCDTYANLSKELPEGKYITWKGPSDQI